jgi:branched-chain amino acid transport system substrate-binding protein
MVSMSWRALGALAAFSLALGACAPAAPAPSATTAPAAPKPTEAPKPAAATAPAKPAAGPLKVGVAISLSGPGAAVGNTIKGAVELKAEELNAAGGVKGSQVDLVFEDTSDRPDVGVNAVNKLITADKVLAIIGAIQSPLTLATMEVSAKNETPQITPVSTNPKVTSSGNPWIFRVAITDAVRVQQLSDYLVQKKGFKNLAILYVNDDFGKGANELFAKEIPSRGGKVVAAEGYQSDGKDFTSELSKVQAANPDALVIWGRQADGALLARQMRDLGIKVPVYGSDGFSSPQLPQLAGDAVNGWVFSTSFLPEAQGKAAQDLDKALRERYKLDPDFSAGQAYDAAGLLFEAMKRADLSGDVAASRKTIRDELRKTKDYPGVIGRLSFDETGDLLVKDFFLASWNNGTMVPVKD